MACTVGVKAGQKRHHAAAARVPARAARVIILTCDDARAAAVSEGGVGPQKDTESLFFVGRDSQPGLSALSGGRTCLAEPENGRRPRAGAHVEAAHVRSPWHAGRGDGGRRFELP